MSTWDRDAIHDLAFALYEALQSGPKAKTWLARALTGGDPNEIDAAARAYRMYLAADGPALLVRKVGSREFEYWLSEDPEEILRWTIGRMQDGLTRMQVVKSQVDVALRHAPEDAPMARKLRHAWRRLESVTDDLRDGLHG